jgi:uncharacterized coiled-coil DUF342 family protein
MAEEPANLVLQLQGLRREMGAMLERQVRDRELITKVYNEVLALRSEVQEIKGDLVGLENQTQNRHSEILSVMRRLDELGAPHD